MITVVVNGASGRMGLQACEAINNNPLLELVGQLGRNDDLQQSIEKLKPQVVVDLTVASAGFSNAQTILNAGACPVIGTSGFVEEQVTQLQALAKEKSLGGVIAPNFSVGAVLMMKFAGEAAKYLPDAEVIEAHSPQKEESPSGTGLRTAEIINGARKNAPTPTSDKELVDGARGADMENVKLHSIRLPGVVAQQTVFFGGTGETLKIEHNSQSRESFMPGICMACCKVVERTELLYGLEHLMD